MQLANSLLFWSLTGSYPMTNKIPDTFVDTNKTTGKDAITSVDKTDSG